MIDNIAVIILCVNIISIALIVVIMALKIKQLQMRINEFEREVQNDIFLLRDRIPAGKSPKKRGRPKKK